MRSLYHAFPLRPPARQWRLLCALIRANSTSTGRGCSPVLSNESTEVKVKVKVGLNTFIPLRWLCHSISMFSTALTTLFSIRHPPKPSPNSPIILLLRHGVPYISKPKNTTSLALNSNATVVRLEYRLSDQHPYPNPIHDVLAGYDWVQKHLARSTQTSNGSYQAVKYAKLGVCGELVGGSLASMLALTECHDSKPGISGAALGNPTVDWTSLFPAKEEDESQNTALSGEPIYYQPSGIQSKAATKASANNRPKAKSSGILSTEGLINLRSTLFAKPQTYFDPFTSPLLFFRTPGYDLPPTPSAYASFGINGSDDDEQVIDDSLPPVKKRRSHRKYPPSTSFLKLPSLRVEVGRENALRAQGLEFAELARRSIGLWEEGGRDSAWEEDGTTKLGAGVGEERVQVIEREELGLWGEREMAEIGQWFGEVLRRS